MSWNDLSRTYANRIYAAVDLTQAAALLPIDALADLFETAGNALEDGLNAAAHALEGGAWVAKRLQAVIAWLGNLLAGVTDFAGVAVKALFGFLLGLIAGLVKVIGAVFLLNGALFLQGAIEIGASLAGALVLPAGSLVSLLQRLLCLQPRERRLTPQESAFLRKIFNQTLSLYNIRLMEGRAGAYSLISNRAFTLGNTIYMKETDPQDFQHILVHECVHIWQYQNIGPRYAVEALGAQMIYGNSVAGAYNWQTESTRGHPTWDVFNKEAQAETIEDIWTCGRVTYNGTILKSSGCFFDLQNLQSKDADLVAEFKIELTDYTPLALAAISALRARKNIRLSKRIKI